MAMKKAHIVLIGLFTAVVLVMVGCEFAKMARFHTAEAPPYRIVGYVSGAVDVSANDADMFDAYYICVCTH